MESLDSSIKSSKTNLNKKFQYIKGYCVCLVVPGLFLAKKPGIHNDYNGIIAIRNIQIKKYIKLTLKLIHFPPFFILQGKEKKTKNICVQNNTISKLIKYN